MQYLIQFLHRIIYDWKTNRNFHMHKIPIEFYDWIPSSSSLLLSCCRESSVANLDGGAFLSFFCFNGDLGGDSISISDREEIGTAGAAGFDGASSALPPFS